MISPWMDKTIAANGVPIKSNFIAWFGESQVRDAAGVPLVVYHVTNDQIDAFNSEKTMDGAFWFTSNKEGAESGAVGAAGSTIVMPVYLSVKKLAGWDEYDRYNYDQLLALGYDGVKLDDDFIVFDACSIKSAVNNSGLYLLSSPSLDDKSAVLSFGAKKVITHEAEMGGSGNLSTSRVRHP